MLAPQYPFPAGQNPFSNLPTNLGLPPLPNPLGLPNPSSVAAGFAPGTVADVQLYDPSAACRTLCSRDTAQD